MKEQLLLSALLTLATLTQVIAAPTAAENEAWPKGINPATMLENTDKEPLIDGPDFVELFNGTDLSGWSVKGGAMTFEAKDGEIIGTTVQGQPNSFLCTDKNYSDFIFTAEFKWAVLGNSGIMFRAATKDEDRRTSVFDIMFRSATKGEGSRTRVFGYQSEMDQNPRRWTGGIYGEAMGGWKYPLSKEEGHAAARAAIKDHKAWNRMTIHAKGNILKTWINGVPCAHLINDERREGFVGLQVHNGKAGTIHWRNIKIKELLPQDGTDLFTDGDFSSWTQLNGKPVSENWSIKNGIIHCSGLEPGGIITKQHYKNFELRFDWKISEAGNSGVKYRTRDRLGAKYRIRDRLGLEYQILDDAKHKDRHNPTHRTGSLYELVAAPDDKPIHPIGEWNHGRILANGNHIEHWLNGEKIIEIEHGSDDWVQRLQNSKYSKHQDFGGWTGPILLQDHNDEVWFRNVQIREL